MGTIQQRADAVGDDILLGGPRKYFESGGRGQLIMLLDEGLEPQHTVCDVGCGALRCGYWLMNFLEPGRYYGIEPDPQRLQIGRERICPPELLERARPTFDTNSQFDLSVFGVSFDYVIARSIWSHAGRAQIEQLLDAFAPHAETGGVLYASAILTWGPGYRSDEWTGASHVSETPGVIRHRLGWIRKAAGRRGLDVSVVSGHRLFRQRAKRKQQKWLLLRVSDAGRP